MRRLIFWLSTLAVILGAYLTIPRGDNTVPREYAAVAPPSNLLDSPDAIDAGRALFLANCAVCHGARGDGQGATQPKFGPKPADFTNRARMRSLSPQYLFWRVSEGGRVEPFRSQGSIMPAWRYQLSEEQRWQVIAFIRSLGMDER
jgi:high-affinity iron transporter